MSGHYEEREQFFDDAVVVFRRGDAISEGEKRFFWARLKIDGAKGFKTISLKTRNRVDAIAKAKSLYLQFSQAVRDGASLDNSRTFERAWKDWYSFMLSEGAWSEARQKWHLGYFNLYFNRYFGEKKLDEITNEFANDYFHWRRKYWVTGPGAEQIAYNRRRRGMKTSSSYNAKTTPSHTTLRMEASALNGFFNWVYSRKRYIRYPIKLKVVAGQRQKNEGKRATFTNLEWRYLTRNLMSWAYQKGKYSQDRVNAFHKHHRQQLRFYVLFLASTGIRSGTEARFMKWSDISSFKADGIEHLRIRISSAGKMGRSRVVISQTNAVNLMKAWRSISHYPADQDLVWYGMSKQGEPQQKPASDLNKTFQAFLKSVAYKNRNGGLLFDADGGRRSLYSLRHLYATIRLLRGVSYEDLMRNMGTGISQLVRHYDHVLTEQRAAEITKPRFRKTLAKQQNDVEQLSEQ